MRIPYLLASLTIFIAMTSLMSCGGSQNHAGAEGDRIEMKYAQYLTIAEHPDFTEVTVKNPWDSTRILQRYILVARDSMLPAVLPQGTLVRTPVNNAVVYSTVHASLISELEADSAIRGMCGVEYITDEELKKRVADGSIADCGNNQNPNIERIIRLQPQVIIATPYQNNDKYAKAGQLGVPIIECAEYMEQTPLGRAEWMRFFGLLFGKREQSERLFSDTESEYMRLRGLAAGAKEHPSVLLDEQYGQVWYVPGANSIMNALITDAGGVNPFAGHTDDSTAGLSPERVLTEAHDADFWLVRYNQQRDKTLAELGGDAPVNGQFKAFKEGKVYGCNTHYIDLFEQTPFHPDRLLRDMIIMLHPGVLSPDTIPSFYKKMR